MKKTQRSRSKITAKNKLFCDWYLKLANATEAAIKAHYSAKTARQIGSKLLTKVNIQEYLRKRRSEYEELLGFNKATLIQDLLKIKDRCMENEPVMEYDRSSREMVQSSAKVKKKNDKGEEEVREVGVYQFDSIGAIKAVETINKMMDYNEPDKIEDVTPSENRTKTIVVKKEYGNRTESANETDSSVGST